MAKVIFKFDDDISTDIIYPGRYMATILPSETPQFTFGDIPELNKLLINNEVPEGCIIVAGKNFGCGSSREQATSTLKGHELVIIAKNFARIFLQNSVNLGLKTITCPSLEAEPGDELVIDGEQLVNQTKGKAFDIIPLPQARQSIVDAGGLIPYTRKKLLEERS
jgi:3-isopropylmalate/(R)-2-methylmalate dehydratase small subunit